MNLLIVDDEPLSVSMLKRKIPWAEIPIDQVYTANDTAFAHQILETFPVDILLCDIEMPGEDGIAFLRRLRAEGRSELVTLLLTCHDDFHYARDAVSLDVMEYLLKPVAYDELTRVLRRAVEERRRRSATRQDAQARQLWEKHRPSVLRSFWEDCLREGGAYSPERGAELGVRADAACLPVLLRRMDRLDALSPSDALLFLERQTRPIFQELGLEVALLPRPEDCLLLVAWGEPLPDARATAQAILARLRELLQSLRLNQIHLCGCMNAFVPPDALREELRRFERFLRGSEARAGMFLVDAAPARDELNDAPGGELFDWLCDYIRAHLTEDFSRQELANAVHLNPDYLTRFFKRRTGLTPMEYVRRERLNLGRHLLRNTDQSIAEIALATGFATPAYFTTAFRREFGCSPSDYRGK